MLRGVEGGGEEEEEGERERDGREGGRQAGGREGGVGRGYIFNFCTPLLSSLSPRRVNQSAVCPRTGQGKRAATFYPDI